MDSQPKFSVALEYIQRKKNALGENDEAAKREKTKKFYVWNIIKKHHLGNLNKSQKKLYLLKTIVIKISSQIFQKQLTHSNFPHNYFMF